MRLTAFAFALLAVVPLAACDMLGIDSPEKIAAAREADGKAIGGACRHAGRAIEDCYAIYRKSDRAAIFAGWRDMNDYMRENKIEPVPPRPTARLIGPKASTRGDGDSEAAPSQSAPAASHNE